MTLIASFSGPESIWMVADRRLSYRARRARPPKDDARKIMFLETVDGQAILGYAGLGATALGTEPADWMSAVLRGRNLPLEPSLSTLSEAIKRQLPRHLALINGAGPTMHNVIIPAFLGEHNRQYTIDLVHSTAGTYYFRYTQHIIGGRLEPLRITPPFALAGSGGAYLHGCDNRWMRPLLRLIKAYDRGLIHGVTVADEFAKLNRNVYKGVGDNSVGPRCIVAWRNRTGSAHKEGSGQQFYTETKRDAFAVPLPIVGRGMDVAAIAAVLLGHFKPTIREGVMLPPTLNVAAINEALANLPSNPDEKLR